MTILNKVLARAYVGSLLFYLRNREKNTPGSWWFPPFLRQAICLEFERRLRDR